MTLNIRSDELFNHFLKTAENIVSHLDHDKDKRNDYMSSLKTIVEKHCVQDEKLKNVTNTVKELIGNLKSDSDPEEIMQIFKDKKKDMLELNPDFSQHSCYKEFCSQVKTIIDHADGKGRETLDDDIEMTQDEVNIIDPFTKRRMTDPVRNKVCTHVYDRESVTSMLKVNKNTRCPVVGCSNKNPILLENLVTDLLTRKYLYHETPVAAQMSSISLDE